jgi:hypothetical protein
MKTRPILFSTDMVKAILEGKKRMTRREINPQPVDHYFQSLVLHATGKFTFVPNNCTNPQEKDVVIVKCPYGVREDILWVRETFMEYAPLQFEYKAGFADEPIKWKSSRFMPKVAARLFLKITDVRVEKLNDISGDDVKSEGVRIPVNNRGTKEQTVVLRLTGKHRALDYLPHGTLGGTYKPTQEEWLKAHFYELWCDINGEDSWVENPWVWVVSFERCEKPEGFLGI